MLEIPLRDFLLHSLSLSFPHPVSGERLAQEAGVSRVAVWKEAQALRAKGFPIQASRAGYRLLSLPDRLEGAFLQALLRDTFPGLRVVFFPELSSTNSYVKELASRGEKEGTVILTENQTQGRGRRGRTWFSQPGKALTFSFLLRPSLSLRLSPLVGLLVALVLAQALEELGFSPYLKWPNDLWIGERKVAGILLESSAEMEEVEWIVVGVGVNVNMTSHDFPEELRSRVTSLAMEKGETIPRWQILRTFFSRFAREYPRFLKEKSFAPWREAFEERSLLAGRRVRVHWEGGEKRGMAVGIDEEGALWIQGEDGEKERIQWGEVSLDPLVN